ncbi:COG4315 family predicted lipoprotein [Ferruginibacter sp.]
MKNIRLFLTVIIISVTLYYSCNKNDSGAAARTDIHLDSNATVGKHIVDKDGRSLYYFSNDANGKSNCTGGCLTNWTVYLADSTNTTFSDGLLSTDFKIITNTSGAKQTTYKGWPLYYYTPSGVAETSGQVTGEAVGGIWFVAKTNYSITVANFQLTGQNGTNYLSNYTPGNGLTAYLCDEKGNALYFFTKDSAYKNKFTKPDFSNNATFPIYETDNITVPSTFDKTLFVVTTFNGRKQLTYKGWPLYYFGADSLVRGSNKGVSFPAAQPAGSIWPVATKDAALAPR